MQDRIAEYENRLADARATDSDIKAALLRVRTRVEYARG
jgi:hypothetical protein